MTTDEVVKVLGRIQLGDNRQADKATLGEWIADIGDLDFQDAIAAVTMHRRESTAYLMPAHIRANVRTIRARRERELRRTQPRAIEPNRITLDRARFEAETQAAIEAARREKGEVA